MKKLTAFALAALASAAVFAEDGNLRYSIMVNKFENKANWRGQWELGDAWGTILTDQLVQSGKFIVLGEADMRGAEINITIYICDSATGQVKASKSVIGKSGKRGIGLGYHGNKLGGLTGDLKGFEKDNMGQACTDAVAQAVEFLVAQLETIPWEGSVSLVKPDKLLINRGSREGVAVGMKFDIGKVEEIVDEDTGEVLDSEMTKIGTVVVTEVKEKISYTTPLEGAEKGMGVHPAK